MIKKKKILAWHFTNGNKLRDGRPVPRRGKVLKHEGELAMCEAGLHASRDILDALHYSPGSILHHVECSGEVIEEDDKLVCSERKILWSIDVEQILSKFVRLCALDVIDKRNAPDVVVQFLKTGDESLRQRAQDAARDVAYGTVWYAARWAAQYIAWDAAYGTAWYVALSAALSAVRDVARDAAEASGDFKAARKKQRKRLLGMIRRARRINHDY